MQNEEKIIKLLSEILIEVKKITSPTREQEVIMDKRLGELFRKSISRTFF